MGEVDVLLPQETLDRGSRATRAEQLSVTRPVDTTEETPSEETPNDSDKQAADANVASDCDDEREMCNGDLDISTDSVAVKKKKHRRGRSKKRKWKPYYKLSWQERRELEERETRRAHRIRDKMFAHGQAVAPYNTTQFLMEDHNVEEPDFDHIQNGHRHNHNERNASMDSSDEFYSSPEDEEDFLQKQFFEVYEDIHAERLSAMSKNELVQEYIQLEERVEELESKLKEARTRLRNNTVDCEVQTPDVFEEQWQKIEIFKEEIRKLTEENVQLRTHNEHLRSLMEYEDDDDDEDDEDEDDDDEDDDDEDDAEEDDLTFVRS